MNMIEDEIYRHVWQVLSARRVTSTTSSCIAMIKYADELEHITAKAFMKAPV